MTSIPRTQQSFQLDLATYAGIGFQKSHVAAEIDGDIARFEGERGSGEIFSGSRYGDLSHADDAVRHMYDDVAFAKGMKEAAQPLIDAGYTSLTGYARDGLVFKGEPHLTLTKRGSFETFSHLSELPSAVRDAVLGILEFGRDGASLQPGQGSLTRATNNVVKVFS